MARVTSKSSPQGRISVPALECGKLGAGRGKCSNGTRTGTGSSFDAGAAPPSRMSTVFSFRMERRNGGATETRSRGSFASYASAMRAMDANVLVVVTVRRNTAHLAAAEAALAGDGIFDRKLARLEGAKGL